MTVGCNLMQARAFSEQTKFKGGMLLNNCSAITIILISGLYLYDISVIGSY